MTAVLLDTQAFVWWVVQPDRLSGAALRAIQSATTAFVSAVSVYEIDIKRARDGVLRRMPEDLVASLGPIGFEWRDVTPTAARDAARLPWIHRDPWDRLIVAQARELGAALVTADQHLSLYDVEAIW
jgi:PIN domain nuclease of toxin-antitoxin system